MMRVSELMSTGVVVAQPDHTVEYVRQQMTTLKIHAVPVAEADGTPVGLVHSRDLIVELDPETPVHEVMNDDVLTVELGTDVKMAAKIMRQHRRHHLIITDAGAIAGILSAFDFLQLIEKLVFEDDEGAEFRTGVFRAAS